jgi:hypothetical protein
MKSKTTSDSGFEEAARVLTQERGNLALLLGNGINIGSGASGGISWNQLMEDLIAWSASNSQEPAETERRLKRLLERGAGGETAASLPEIFDIIEATGAIKPGESGRKFGKLDLQSRIAETLKVMKPGDPHKAVTRWAAQSDVPILTTNYDHCFQDALDSVGCRKRRFGDGRPLSDFYPWDRYYAPKKVADPAKAFAVWHIHGDQDLKRSIRAGLDQYMGMVERLRKLKRPVAEEIFLGLNEDQPSGRAFYSAPWLRIFMGNKLWIQSLGLRAAEVSIRWLLVQRFRYWKRYNPSLHDENGWYVHGPTEQIGPLDEGRRNFFENVGLKVIEIAKPDDAYLNLFGSRPNEAGAIGSARGERATLLVG